MSNEHDAIFVDDSTSDDNDNEVIPVSSLRFSRPGRPDAPIEIDSDGNAEHHLFYQNSMPAPLTPNAEMAYCTNPNRLLSPNMAYANPLQASRTNGRPKKRQKSSLSPDTKKKTFMPTSLWEHNSRKSNQSSDDESAHKRILVPKTLRSASSKKIPKSRSLQPELSLSSSVRSTAHESSVRCPLCWLHFSSDLIEDHIDNCGKPEASRRSPRVIPRAPKQKILNDSSCQVGKQVYDFTSFDEDKEPPVKTNKRKASKPRRVSRRHDDEEAEEDRKLPAKPSGKGTDGSRGYPLGLRVEVEGALRNTRKAQSTSRNNLLKKMIMAKNQMLQYGKPRRLQPLPDYRRLPDIDGEILDSSYLRQEDHPLPTDAHHTIFVRKHFSSLGTEKEDDDDEDVNPSAPSPCISPALEVESWDDAEEVGEQLSPSNKQYADKIAEFRTVRIALYEEDELDQEIDEVLKLFKHSKHNRQGVHEYLAILLQVETQRVTKRWEKANGATEPRRQHDTQYEEAMSSFRDLFCRRCLIFDCNLHGLQDDYPPEIQLELAIRLENSGYWKVCDSYVGDNFAHFSIL